MKNLFTLILFTLTLTVCAQDADWALTNAKIYTADDGQSFAEAMAVLDGAIIFVGDNDGVQSHIGPNTQVSDLQGKVILPGLHDVHIHLLEASSEAASSCTLNGWAWDATELAVELEACDPEPNGNGWIMAYGHSILTLLEGGENPRDVLDQYFPNTPVAAMEESSHSAWVNSAALEALSIDENTPDPDGGHIVKDNGVPNGILLDSAGDLAFSAAQAPTDNIDEMNYEGLVEFGLPAIAQQGITSIVEGRTYWKRNYIETWQQVKSDGELTARVVLAPWLYPSDADEDLIPAVAALYDEGDNMLKITQVKCYIDGHTLNGTAALDQPYVYAFGWPFDNGLNYLSQDRLQGLIEALEPIGFDFFIHAIGNRGAEESLNAIEAAQATVGTDGRHRLTHLEVCNEAEYPRFGELGVIADMQVTANWTNPNQWAWNATYIGADLAEVFIPLGSIAEAGAMVTTSSDWDVSSMNPFRGLENAVTRAPEELASVEDAVDTRTINSAFCMRNEEITGSLEVGKLADFICIDQDIFTIPQNQIGATNVTLTVLGGQVIHDDGTVDTAIEELDRNDGFSVLPTVTRDYFTISLTTPESQQVRLSVFNLEGQLIHVEAWSHAGEKSSITLDVDAFAEGQYIFNLKGENGALISSQQALVYR